MRKATGIIIALAIIIGIGGAAAARDAGGKLSFILNPISTRPVFVHPGEKINVDVAKSVYESCSCVFSVFLEKGGSRMRLEPSEKMEGPATGTYRFTVAIPADTAAGLYGVAAHKGGNDDVSRHSIMVLDKFPTEYTIMHISDVHIGRIEGDYERGKDFYTKIAARANEIKPDMVIITGDVTDFSDPAQFKAFLDITDTINSPTVVVAGNHDRNNSDADKYLGPGRFWFMYGDHFYLGFDTQYQFPTPDPDKNMEWIKRETRAHKEAPFKVLFSHREDSDLRFIISQVLLPQKVNLFLSGHYHAGGEEKIGSLPLYYLIDKASVDGFYETIKIKDNAVAEVKMSNVADK